MAETARLQVGDQSVELPVVVGSEGEKAVDIAKLRADTGYIALDSGYGNTGSCQSDITFIDGDAGILRYRGYAIEDLAEYSRFIEVAHLLIWGELPNAAQLDEFSELLTKHQMLREELKQHFSLFPPNSPPMAVLSSVLNALSCYYPELLEIQDEETFIEAAARIMSKVRTIAAYSHRQQLGHHIEYPHPRKRYAENFLHMMFSQPYNEFEADPALVDALDLIFLLHADHEQNCSTSTVRMVGSSEANLFASVAAGVSALWGPLHGGANVAVVNMLETIRDENTSVSDYVAQVKDKKAGIRLMGFGHRVYKNFDPRAKIIKRSCEKVLAKLHINDPLLDIAKELEAVALEDEYFIQRKLYPNVDFYSGVILRALGIPKEMFTVIFAIGRMPGWIAHWYEESKATKISRPRQIYTGSVQRTYQPLAERP
ncbi:MAG: citrate synthase [Gemmatimonadetes bacterium]|nr:citrate synthase [Gemmatimonadota bacterium]MYB70428.1 citrate synthase [Gemmatimonadota bacterium]